MAETRVARAMTVTGPVPAGALGVIDAHNHVWLAPPGPAEGADVAAGRPAWPDLPTPADIGPVIQELADYRAAGGGAIADCQPGRAGRAAAMLRRLAVASGVAIIACTGFHLRRYYLPDEPFWSLPADAVADHFIGELLASVEDAPGGQPIRAGFIKVACEETLAASPLGLLEAAAWAAAETGAALEVHTEMGASAEAIVPFLTGRGVQPGQIVLCHMDKRPDFGLHRELAAGGVLLEYDTFYRPKYDPERNVWPLLERMIAAGLASAVAIATDMAGRAMWARLGGGPGLAALLTVIRPRLQQIGAPGEAIAALLGGNIARRFAFVRDPGAQEPSSA